MGDIFGIVSSVMLVSFFIVILVSFFIVILVSSFTETALFWSPQKQSIIANGKTIIKKERKKERKKDRKKVRKKESINAEERIR